MNVQQLKADLLSNGLRPDVARFNETGHAAAEYYCIRKNGPVWETYYFERGNQNDLRNFADENAACTHFMELLKKDQTVWQK